MHTTMQTPRTQPNDPRPVYDGPEPELEAAIAAWQEETERRTVEAQKAEIMAREARKRAIRAETILSGLYEARNRVTEVTDDLNAAY